MGGVKNNAANVSTGKPAVGGAFFRAPLKTKLPANAKEEIDDGFKNLGYISDDGLSNTNERDVGEIKAWGGDVVGKPQKSKKDEFELTFIEIKNPEVCKLVFGDENVTGTDIKTGIKIIVNAKELPHGSYVVDMIMSEGDLKRVVIPDGQVIKVAEVNYKDDDAIGYKVTIAAYPDLNGNTHYEYMQSQN